jgi:DNA-binding transcriptional LysR family regulator
MILTLSDEALTVIRDMDHARGKLMLGSLEATALHDLPELLAAYHRQYPDVSLSLQTDMNDVFLDQVLTRKLDGAFVSGPVSHPNIEEQFFKTDELILVGSGETGKKQGAKFFY